MKKTLMKGNEALAEAAIQAGCRSYFGYPITPQNELIEYMSRRMPEVGGAFVQAESEISAVNMLLGAGASGIRAMTSSSGPGISLKQEGISYLAGAEIPAVIVNVVRAGPGLGGIGPAQSDYFQATKGGGHGDYRVIVLAPGDLQETVDLTRESFWLADLYRNPVMIYIDAILGQMMEPVKIENDIKKNNKELPKIWSAVGESNKITSLFLDPEELEKRNLLLKKKYQVIEKKENRCEIINARAKYFLVAYGTPSRICKEVIKIANNKGLDIGLIRPLSLWPFPYKAFELVEHARAFMCVEMSLGQMIEDVKLAVSKKAPVYFYGRTGGVVPEPEDVMLAVEEKMIKGELVEL